MCKQYVPARPLLGKGDAWRWRDLAAFQWDYAILVPQVRHTARNGKGLGTGNHQGIHARYLVPWLDNYIHRREKGLCNEWWYICPTQQKKAKREVTSDITDCDRGPLELWTYIGTVATRLASVREKRERVKGFVMNNGTSAPLSKRPREKWLVTSQIVTEATWGHELTLLPWQLDWPL